MTKKAKKVKSTAKTAYALLSEVRALILDEPKRYNQGVFVVHPRQRNAKVSAPLGFPACGTVGCVAGWVATLKAPKPLKYPQVEEFARRTLGLTSEQMYDLFDGSALSYLSGYGPNNYDVQTKAYARLGAKHITAFQKAHAAQLKATRV